MGWFTSKEETYKKQKALSEKCLTKLILLHEEKRLVCSQLFVGSIYKEVMEFDQNYFYNDGENKSFLGAWKGVPIYFSPAIEYSSALALSNTIGFPTTNTDELGNIKNAK